MSFARAADELCVTPGAVSQHVRTLEDALGIELFRRKARSIELDARRVPGICPPIRNAFELISDATESNAPALRGLKFRVGVTPAVQKAGCPAVQQLLARKASGLLIGLGMRDEPALVADGRVHALLRTSDEILQRAHHRAGSHPQRRGTLSAVLVTRPGLAGCRQHRALVKLLHDLSQEWRAAGEK